MSQVKTFKRKATVNTPKVRLNEPKVRLHEPKVRLHEPNVRLNEVHDSYNKINLGYLAKFESELDLYIEEILFHPQVQIQNSR